MSYFEIIINSEIYQLIPTGFCACGCGKRTSILKTNNKKYGWIKGKYARFLPGHNFIIICKYIRGKIGLKSYSSSSVNGIHVRDHRILAEKAFGKPLLPKAVVHHHTPDQLVICQNQSYHRFLHLRTRAYEACGHANWRKCTYCQQWDSPDNLYVPKTQLVAHHRECHNRYQRLRRLEIINRHHATLLAEVEAL